MKLDYVITKQKIDEFGNAYEFLCVALIDSWCISLVDAIGRGNKNQKV